MQKIERYPHKIQELYEAIKKKAATASKVLYNFSGSNIFRTIKMFKMGSSSKWVFIIVLGQEASI